MPLRWGMWSQVFVSQSLVADYVAFARENTSPWELSVQWVIYIKGQMAELEGTETTPPQVGAGWWDDGSPGKVQVEATQFHNPSSLSLGGGSVSLRAVSCGSMKILLKTGPEATWLRRVFTCHVHTWDRTLAFGSRPLWVLRGPLAGETLFCIWLSPYPE